MIEWLNANSGALTVVATFVLVLVTVWYVHLTRQLLKSSYKPEVIVYLRASPTLIRENLQVNETTLCVKNSGQGVARKLSLETETIFLLPLMVASPLRVLVSLRMELMSWHQDRKEGRMNPV